MGSRKRICAWIVATALTFGPGGAAQACAFHGYTPDPTLVDVLLATEQVVIARPAPDDPTRYAVVETLAGPPTTDIPIDVSPNVRGRLAEGAATAVLLARDGAYGPWLELAVLDQRYRAVVGKVLARQADWLAGRDKDRLRYFAQHLNHPNPDLRRLALREMDRVDYGSLQRAKLPQIRNLSRDLKNGDGDLLPIRLLLAGLSKDRGFSGFLTSELSAAIRSDRPYLGAYATALIELEGADGVSQIVDTHLLADTASGTAREKLLEALAIQYRTAAAPTRRAIAREVAMLSRRSPGLAEAAARQFGSLARWGQADGAGRTGIDR